MSLEAFRKIWCAVEFGKNLSLSSHALYFVLLLETQPCGSGPCVAGGEGFNHYGGRRTVRGVGRGGGSSAPGTCQYGGRNIGPLAPAKELVRCLAVNMLRVVSHRRGSAPYSVLS